MVVVETVEQAKKGTKQTRSTQAISKRPRRPIEIPRACFFFMIEIEKLGYLGYPLFDFAPSETLARFSAAHPTTTTPQSPLLLSPLWLAACFARSHSQVERGAWPGLAALIDRQGEADFFVCVVFFAVG